MIKLLLLSNSTMPGTTFFTWPRHHVQAFLGEACKDIVFIPYAAVTLTFDDYATLVSEALEPLGYRTSSIHHAKDKRALLDQSDAVVVGGGNTFALLARMYEEGLLDPVREHVRNGKRYVGWSAGANLACPTIMTTNDMPVVRPPSFDALGAVPFQINAHYHELRFQNQGGETRRQRLEEFLVLNPDKKVIGLPEGMGICRIGQDLKMVGEGTAKLYEAGKEIADLTREQDISFLLE